ncbi:MAG: DUF1573 domain-containing protein, partial [Planctomycetota bacterium]
GPGGAERLDTGVDLTALRPRGATRPAPPPEPAVEAPPAPPAVGPTLPAAGAGAPVHGGVPGHMSLLAEETALVDFGKVKQGDKRSHVFQLVSDGENDLVISRFKSSCGCTVAKMQAENEAGEMTEYHAGDPIPSGRKFEIYADIATDGKPQGPMETSVSLFSNDVRGVFTVRMKCEVETVLAVLPGPNLVFGQITAADRVEGSLRVTSDSLGPYRLTVDERYVTEPLSVSLSPVEPDAEGRATTWDVHLALGPGIPEGLRNYPLLLLTDKEIPYPKQPPADGSKAVYIARIYVQATVKGLLTAEPAFLSFGMVRPGQVVDRTIKIECLDDFPLAADCPVRLEAMRPEMEFPHRDRFTWKIEPTADPKVLDLSIRLEGMPENLNGSFGGFVHVDVGHPLKPTLSIRFSGVCRQGLPGEEPAAGRAAGAAGGQGR